MADHQNHDQSLPDAVNKLARAIRKLAEATGRQLSEDDRALLAATLAVSEAVTIRVEQFAAALKQLDERTPPS